MNVEEFHSALRKLVRARPFQPFVFVLNNGSASPVDAPAVAFDGGGASFMDAQGVLQSIDCEQVREIKLLTLSHSHSAVKNRASKSTTGAPMTAEHFEETMRSFLRRDPFEPFIVQTDNNQLIVIANPKAVALAAGGAGYIGSNKVHFIESANVVDIRSMKEQIAT